MNSYDQLINSISLTYQQMEASTDPLAMRAITTILAITLYAMFVGSFYQTLSKKRIFELNIPKPSLFGEEEHVRLWDIIVFMLQYTIAFPIITLVWTFALTVFLLALSSSSPWDVAILSMSIVASTRICAYYDENIAVDVAKLLPIALLAIVVSNPAVLSYGALIEKLGELIAISYQFLPIFIFLICLEWALRLLLEIKYMLFGRPDEEKTDLDKLLAHYAKKGKT